MCRKQKKIKLFCPIWKNPLNWARSVAGSKLRATFAILFHIIALMMICFFIAVAVGFDGGRQFMVKALPVFGTLVMLANIYSIYYIYVICRLIKIIDQNKIMEDK